MWQCTAAGACHISMLPRQLATPHADRVGLLPTWPSQHEGSSEAQVPGSPACPPPACRWPAASLPPACRSPAWLPPACCSPTSRGNPHTLRSRTTATAFSLNTLETS